MKVYHLSFTSFVCNEGFEEWERYFSTLEKAQVASNEYYGGELAWAYDDRFKEWVSKPPSKPRQHYYIYERDVE